VVAATLAGCHYPVQRVPVPAPGNRDVVIEHDPAKPLPNQEPPVGFDDVALVNQRPPEQRAFVDAYNRVGRPRIAVFVNRTMQGEIVPVTRSAPAQGGGQADPFAAQGTAESREFAQANTRSGQQPEPQAQDIDYAAVETILTDWIANNGQVMVISPTAMRQKLSPEQVRDLESGRSAVLGDVAQQFGADVLVQAQARPTRESFQGSQIRMVVEAINIKGGDSIARSVVDIAPPLDKPQINTYTRYVARKLMDDMIGAWSNMQPASAAPAANPAPGSVPPVPPAPQGAPPASTAPGR
jgi:hypothetical protein